MIKELLLDILLPKKCIGCGKEGQYICKDCEIFLSEVDSHLDMRCPNRDIACPNITSIWEYEGIIEKAILKIKFDGQYHIIDELIEKAFKKIELNLPKDAYIAYVPMWKKKERQRGFNQAELIARKLGNVLHLVEHNLLEKVRDNRSQVGLGPQERVDNVRGVFRVTLDIPNIRNVLLVDDVYTTGATMNECIKVLKRAGIKNIWGFTLARKMSIQSY
ncbi:ComF family protein [Patescibacteria group bacterium]|nr:ComF family protein [Patescibacteria group bacterium]